MRRQEFLNKKRNPSSKNSCDVEAVSDAPSCGDQCDYKAASEKGLKQHKRMKHNASELASSGNSANQSTPEKEILEDAFNILQPSEMREEILSVNADLSSSDTTLVLPHFCLPNPKRPEDNSDQWVFACGDCLYTSGQTSKKSKIVPAQTCMIVLRTVFI